MYTTNNLNQFVGYDLALAKCHMANWGTIYLDEFHVPMEIEDVLYMLENN